MKLRFGITKKENTLTTNINWTKLKDLKVLDQIKEESQESPILIFKHSTRCPTSSMALNRLERNWDSSKVNDLKHYFLDLINYRDISNQIAADFSIMHQSPQVMIISDGKCIYNDSHMGISFAEIENVVNQQTA
jgi:bacillithiol system protein YtxJ